MTVPRIGLTTYVEDARWGVWAEPAALLPTTYVATVAAAGGLPVLLPPIVPGDLDVAAGAALAGVEGLVLTGGSDVDPGRYDAPAHPATDAPQPERDAWELAVLRAALAAHRPVLAVCRGVQLLNVALGGTLHQHLPDVIGRSTHRPELGAYAHLTVEVDVDSRLAAIIGIAPEVHCHHHQAIDRLGDGLAVCARASDGTIEAVELAGPSFAIGVQWHPEEDGEDRLFSALIEAAAVPAA